MVNLVTLIRRNDGAEGVGDFIINIRKKPFEVSGEMIANNLDMIGIFLDVEAKRILDLKKLWVMCQLSTLLGTQKNSELASRTA